MCLHCNEEVFATDEGRAIVGCLEIDESGPVVRQRWIHRECRTRMIAGGLGHQQGSCSCHTDEGWEDPPGMSLREAAIAAHEYFCSMTAIRLRELIKRKRDEMGEPN